VVVGTIPFARGCLISADERNVYDFDRLERVVKALVRKHRQAQEENAALRRKVEEKSRNIRSLEGRLLEANQRRQDVAKRLDELIAQLDHLEGQLGTAEL
jgi:septal ring factor EnvC (AmiA/AmiB activator)